MNEANNIQKRLYDLETAPPPGMWSRIAAKLDEETSDKSEAPVFVMPVQSRKNNWTRIALAASFLGFVTMSALWFFQSKNKNTSTTGTTVKTGTETKIIRDTVFLPGTENKQVNLQTDQNLSNNNIPQPLPPNNINTNPVKGTQPEKNQDLQKTEAPELVKNIIKPKDIIIKDDKGNPIRNIEVVKTTDPANMSGPDSKGDKAIANMLNRISLASDKEEIDSIINNSNYWKNQIRVWRTQLIRSGYAPSLINQMDILELKKLVDQ
jgi:hypothetical protein